MGCIYKITNKINKKVYIGKTEGEPIQRWHQHLYSAKNAIDFAIYRAMNKYGIENFSFEVIEDNIFENDINEKEKYYISYYNSYNNGYNMTLGGDGVSSFSHLDIKNYYLQNPNLEKVAQYFNCSTATVRRVLKEYDIYENYNNINFAKAVNQYDLKEDKLLNTYVSLSEACKSLNKTGIAPIRDACEGKTSQAYGYRWKYYNDTTPLKIAVSGFTKKVAQIDKNTNAIIAIFESAKIASEKTGCDSSSITKVCRGTRKTCGGFKWTYFEEN